MLLPGIVSQLLCVYMPSGIAKASTFQWRKECQHDDYMVLKLRQLTHICKTQRHYAGALCPWVLDSNVAPSGAFGFIVNICRPCIGQCSFVNSRTL